MKNKLFFRKCINCAALLSALLSAVLYVSCNDTFDNIKDFNVKEIVYPGHFDTAYTTIGFERVEIDLCQAGRIPSEEMNLGKATQTVIEFINNGRDTTIVIPEVRSWVNVTGLTEPNMYQFRIYSADEYGNRSKPVEVSESPYTRADLDALYLPEPSVAASTSAAMVQWKSGLSSRLYDVLNWSYSYRDRDGNTVSGGGDNDIPSFFIENVVNGVPASVNIIATIIPRLNDVPILDAIERTFPVTVTLGTKPIIFLEAPANNHAFGTDVPVFIWKRVDEVNDYTLKFSDTYIYPEDANKSTLFSVHAGNTDTYAMTPDDISALNARFAGSGSGSVRPFYYWTVTPADATDATIQSRSASVGVNVLPLTPTGGGANGIGVEAQADGVYVLTTSNGDPFVYSSNLNKVINPGISTAPGNTTITFEYKVNTDFYFEFFFSRPNAEGGYSDGTQVARSDDWKLHTFDIGAKAGAWNWGSATNHRFRLDIGASAGIILYMRNLQVNVR